MNKYIKHFAKNSEFSSIHEIEMSNIMSNTEFLKATNTSSVFSNTESFSFKSPVSTKDSSECSMEESIKMNSEIMKTDSTAEPECLVSVVKSSEPMTEVEELIELINLQKEETEEMLEMISGANEKSEFFITRVEHLVKSLQGISKDPVATSKIGNTYLKSMYKKKLEEFASSLLNKVQKSVKDLESINEVLKEQKMKTEETFQKVSKFYSSSESCATEISNETFEELEETVCNLAEDICLLKPKQLWEIENVSRIETDIEMLYDLYKRFSSIDGPNLAL